MPQTFNSETLPPPGRNESAALAGESPMMTTVAIVEDNAIIRQTLAGWIEAAPGYRCVGTFGTGEEALAQLPHLAPDVVIMDIQLPNISGIACTARLRQLLPKAQVIIVTVYRDYDKIFQALKAGACGYLLKRSSKEEILQAIAEVRTGGAPMSSEIARRVVTSFRQPVATEEPSLDLSRREEEVLDLICKGYANKEIADRLSLSVETIRTHLKRIYEKLHVRCRTEAAMKYREGREQGDGTAGIQLP
jgi:DNA-binding NarL/FixJ family response regulator